MLVHSVYFWLKKELKQGDRNAFCEALEKLQGIETVQALYVGRPAGISNRPVVEGSYDFGLTVVFDDSSGHDVYQVHPLHQQFLSRFSSFWERIQVFDTE